MSGYILCQTKRAEVPYYIENISTNIYSLEELCYYLYHNLYLADRTILNEELCEWVQKELELAGLALKLRAAIKKSAGMADILYPVFKEINYLSYEELKRLDGRLRKLEEEPAAVREKQKGDSLVGNGMYVNAIHVYQELLKQENLEEVREGLTESVYHNMGCAYSYLFQMEKALECFMEAYQCKKSQDALKCYLLAFKSVRTPIEYESRLAELGAGEDVKKQIQDALEQFARRPEKPVYSQHIDRMIEEFMAEYHRSTGS